MLFLLPGNSFPYFVEWVAPSPGLKRRTTAGIIDLTSPDSQTSDAFSFLPSLQAQRSPQAQRRAPSAPVLFLSATNLQIQQLVEVTGCTPEKAYAALSHFGSVEEAVNHYLRVQQSKAESSTSEPLKLSAGEFYSNTIPICSHNQGALGLADIIEVRETAVMVLSEVTK